MVKHMDSDELRDIQELLLKPLTATIDTKMEAGFNRLEEMLREERETAKRVARELEERLRMNEAEVAVQRGRQAKVLLVYGVGAVVLATISGPVLSWVWTLAKSVAHRI